MGRQHSDYTIGWICSLPKELEAANAMLDEQHASLKHDTRDNNIYLLGRIAGHNVVVASLPPNYHGSTAAAVVARDMLWSFPAIKFLLLVGIGGGSPSRTQDIRLGDVVVSTPSSTSRGVIQYDSGKALGFGVVQRTGHLNSPPSVLLARVFELRSQHSRHGLDFGHYVLKALDNESRMRRRFSYPGRGQDLLFAAACTHLQGASDCLSCDSSQIIHRPERDNQSPKVHYGLIASGNLLIKDPIARDRISDELGVLCFEMEAAGIMNQFPCLVVRGIADYCDTHRYDRWQGYAALAAAAYTKELLYTIPRDVETDTTAAEFLDLDLAEGRGPNLGGDTSDTNSETSTLVGSLEPSDVEAAIKKVADMLALNEKVHALCTVAVLRVMPAMLQWNLVVALTVFSENLGMVAQTPVEHGTNWLIRHYKRLIAIRLTEKICRQEHIVVSLGLTQEETASVSDGRLIEVPKDRFLAGQATRPTSSMDRTLEEDNTINLEEVPTQDLEGDLEFDAQEPPESATLNDLSQLDQILCNGTAFEAMYEKLKMLLFPSVPQMIEKVLAKHLAPVGQFSTVKCVIEWEMLQYLRYENVHAHDIDHIFTLNGEFDRACAIPLGAYVSEMWENGRELLGVVKDSIAAAFQNVFETVQTRSQIGTGPNNRTVIELNPLRARNEKEHAIVHVSGSFNYISQTLEQLAWLTATLRLHHEGQLTVSYVDFRALRTRIKETTEAYFRLCLWDQDKLPQPASGKIGQCWTSLFTESVLAYGFPLPGAERPVSMIGLELPFDIMAQFGGVTFPVVLGERLVFASSASILIPEVISGDSVQWHLDTIDNVLRQVSTANKASDPRLENLDASNLRKSRAFLGYNKTSEIVIGTADFDETIITECQVPRTGVSVTLNYTGSLGLTLGAKGYTTANAGTTWRFNRGESAQIRSSELQLDELLKRSAQSPALLYDDQKCIAFLVPELSIVLQMAATYLRGESLLAKAKIPRAKRSFNGRAAAYEAVKAAKDLVIPLGTGSPVKYVDVLKDFLLIFEQRKTQKSLRRHFGEISIKKGLRGWDYSDVQKKKFEFWERELPTNILKSRPIWWKLFKNSTAIILFCRGEAYPISGRGDKSSPSCISWADVLEGHNFLLANVHELEGLRAELCQTKAKHPTRFMLTNKLAWARPVGSRLFEEDCTPGSFCNPLQTIRKVSDMKETNVLWHKEPKFNPNPGSMAPEGSVLFADDPDAFGLPQCRFDHPGPVAPHINWKIAIGSLCVPFLAYMLSTLLQSVFKVQFLWRAKIST